MSVPVTGGVATPARDQRGSWAKALKLIGVLCASATVTAAIVLLRERIRALGALGYPGVFLVSLLSNATVIFPAPGLAFTFAMGSVLNPLAIGLLAGLGESLGELTGYLAGYAGRSVVGASSRSEFIEQFTRHYGALAIFLLALIPAAVFDVVGLAAGAMRMPIHRFLLCTFAGKAIKTTIVAFAGFHSVSWIAQLLS